MSEFDILDDFLNDSDFDTLLDIFAESNHINASTKQLAFHRDLRTTVALVTAFSVLVVMTFVCNIFVCCVIIKNKKMHTVTNVFIVNMSVSDIMLVFLNIPLNIARYLMEEWTLGNFLCHMWNYSLVVSVYVSTFTLTAIALDRHRVLLYPLQPRITKRKSFVVLAFIWCLSLTFALPYGMFTKVGQYEYFITPVKRCISDFPEPNDKWEQYLTIVTLIFQYVLPLCVIAVAYSRIIHKLWVRTHLGVLTETQRIIQIQTKRKSIKLLVAVVIVFAVCWLPINLYHVLTDLHPDTTSLRYSYTAFFICHWIAISSSCINPILYCWMNPNFRAEMRAQMKCLLKSRHSEYGDENATKGTHFRHKMLSRRSTSNPFLSSSSSDSKRQEKAEPNIRYKYVGKGTRPSPV